MIILQKNLKLNRVALLFSMVLLMMTIFNSCEKQEEEMENRDAFVGQWDVVENEAGINPVSVELRNINDAYIVNVARSQVFADEANIYNFFQIGDSKYVPAFVEEKNITIPKITLDGISFRGSGTISNNNKTIEWTYWVDIGDGGEVEYIATYTLRE